MAAQENAELRDLIVRSSAYAGADLWGQDALQVNRRLTELVPDSSPAWWRLGACLEEARDVDGARRAFVHAAERASGGAERRAANRRVERIDAGMAAMKVDSFEEAHRHATNARDRGRVDEALVWHARALDLAGAPAELAQAHASWAATLRGDRKWEEAVSHAREARAHAPNQTAYSIATTVLAAALADLGRLGEAEAAINDLLEHAPPNAYANKAAMRIFFDLAKRTGNPEYRRRAEELSGGQHRPKR